MSSRAARSTLTSAYPEITAGIFPNLAIFLISDQGPDSSRLMNTITGNECDCNFIYSHFTYTYALCVDMQ